MSLNLEKSKSFVWQHFEKIKNKEEAMCSICQKILKCVFKLILNEQLITKKQSEVTK